MIKWKPYIAFFNNTQEVWAASSSGEKNQRGTLHDIMICPVSQSMMTWLNSKVCLYKQFLNITILKKKTKVNNDLHFLWSLSATTYQIINLTHFYSDALLQKNKNKC